MTAWHSVALCHLDDLPICGSKGFDPLHEGQDTIFVVRQGVALYAYRDVCPHYGNTTLPWRKDEYLNADGETIVCAAHGAHFEIKTGLCTQGVCLGQSLTAIPLEVSDAGQVVADLTTRPNI